MFNGTKEAINNQADSAVVGLLFILDIILLPIVLPCSLLGLLITKLIKK